MHVTVAELKSALDRDEAYVVDVREPAEYDSGHVPGAVLMPMATIPVRHHELPRDRTVYVICEVGRRSHTAASWLAQQGYDVRNVSGGTSDWRALGYGVTRGRTP